MSGRANILSITRPSATWRAIGCSVRGASHERSGRPNQDAIAWHPDTGTGTLVCLAVSDGHGSVKSFRSAEGAGIAVRTAIEVTQRFLDGQPDLTNHSAIKRTAEEGLPQALVRAWVHDVHKHLDRNPFTEGDWELAQDKDRGSVRQAVGKNPLLAYGATLLTVLIAPTFMLHLQLGDGDILCVSENGDVSRPLQRDERLIANETTSLCLDRAWRDFQVVFQPIRARPPALIMVSTDGYANSFRTEADFLKVGSDLLGIVRSDGLDAVRAGLEEWLIEASAAGSGDDVTLGIICRTE